MELYIEPERVTRNKVNGRFMKGRKSPLKGRKWKDIYTEEEYKRYIERSTSILKPNKKGECQVAGVNKRAVVAIKNGSFVYFESAEEAKRKTGIHSGNILLCCKGVRKTCGGFRWFYENDEEWIKLINQG